MNFIVAVDENWNIGKDNDLLIKIPEDMKFFRSTTLNKTVVMGRKTLESFPEKKPLPKRKNIVITRNKDYKCKDVETVSSIDELFNKYDTKSDDIFVIGGASIYNALMPYCKHAYITKIYKTFDADTKILSLDEKENWKIISKSDIKEFEGIKFQFLVYENTDI